MHKDIGASGHTGDLKVGAWSFGGIQGICDSMYQGLEALEFRALKAEVWSVGV